MKIKNREKDTQLEQEKMYRENISDEQLCMIVTRKSKAKKLGKLFCWKKMSKLLNSEGPIIQSTEQWRWVSIRLLYDLKLY